MSSATPPSDDTDRRFTLRRQQPAKPQAPEPAPNATVATTTTTTIHVQGADTEATRVPASSLQRLSQAFAYVGTASRDAFRALSTRDLARAVAASDLQRRTPTERYAAGGYVGEPSHGIRVRNGDLWLDTGMHAAAITSLQTRIDAAESAHGQSRTERRPSDTRVYDDQGALRVMLGADLASAPDNTVISVVAASDTPADRPPDLPRSQVTVAAEEYAIRDGIRAALLRRLRNSPTPLADPLDNPEYRRTSDAISRLGAYIREHITASGGLPRPYPTILCAHVVRMPSRAIVFSTIFRYASAPAQASYGAACTMQNPVGPPEDACMTALGTEEAAYTWLEGRIMRDMREHLLGLRYE